MQERELRRLCPQLPPRACIPGRSPSPIAPALPRFQSLSPLLPSPLQAAGDTAFSSCSPPVLHQVLLVFLNSSAIKCYSIALLGAPCDCRQAPNHCTSQSLLLLRFQPAHPPASPFTEILTHFPPPFLCSSLYRFKAPNLFPCL